jgi:tRNA-guanine transglycosylase
MKKFFKVIYRSKKSKARLGEIKTAHGVIKTPAFVAVGTKGTVKSILPGLLREIGTQAVFVNTYHLLTHPGAAVIEKAGGIHRYSDLDLPLMSDSGGFQVFSLAKTKMLGHQFFLSPVGSPPTSVGASQVEKKLESQETQEKPAIVKISEEGVKFRSTFDGRIIELTAEKSIAYQKKIGADLLMAFDECIPYGVSYQYAKEATERTHYWLERSIKEFKKDQPIKKQYLYGIIQGGMFEDLRKKSAEFVVSKNTDGVAIGGVSVGESKKEMRDQVRCVVDYLPADRPVHLLGVGHFDDIFDLVSCGIDTFDCVEPTRLARMGNIYQVKSEKFKVESFNIEKIDILKGVYREDFSRVDENCDCYVCRNFTKSYLHHLFKNRELLAYTLATYHNLWVMERFFDMVREMIEENKIYT